MTLCSSRPVILWSAILFLVVLMKHSAYACPEDEEMASVRFNLESNRLYLEGEGCITPTQIYEMKLSSSNDTDNYWIPIKAVTEEGQDSENITGFWIFTSDVYVYNGVKLELHLDSGTTALRLKSDTGAGANDVVELRAHGGWLSMLNTEVSSWDEAESTYQSFTNESLPRSYITAISEMLETPAETCIGHAKNNRGEARMDNSQQRAERVKVINSEIHHLGYYNTEAYGVTYKVRGFCKDLSNEHIFETVNVRGDIRFSDLHHNHFGMYSYGHQDGLWEYNLMHDNSQYGFDPHDDSDNLRIHNNIVYNNGNHGIIASKRCNDVSIQNNVIYDNDNAGIMLHRSSDSAVVRNNTISGSADACIAIFESMEGDYSNNTCMDNKYGFRWSVGASFNKIYDNFVANSTQYGLYFYEGSDPPDVTDGKPAYNIIANNVIHTATEGLKMADTVGNEFIYNVFLNTPDLRFRSSVDVIWQNNTIPSELDIEVDAKSCITEISDYLQLANFTESGEVPLC